MLAFQNIKKEEFIVEVTRLLNKVKLNIRDKILFSIQLANSS